LECPEFNLRKGHRWHHSSRNTFANENGSKFNNGRIVYLHNHFWKHGFEVMQFKLKFGLIRSSWIYFQFGSIDDTDMLQKSFNCKLKPQ
jgi:hypothetical protein